MNTQRVQSVTQKARYSLRQRAPRPRTAQKRSPDTPQMENIYVAASQVVQHNRVSSVNRLAKQGEWEVVRGSKKTRIAQLEQQNRALKKTINQLVNNLAAAKGRTATVQKRNEKYQRMLHIGDNETYWNNPQLNQHLVVGIRSMYDKLKDKYDHLQSEYNQLIKYKNVTRQLEYVKYIDALEETLKKHQLHAREPSKQVIQQDLLVEISLLKERLTSQHSKNILLKAKLEDRDLQLQLRNKLLTEKDNECHVFKKTHKKHLDRIQELKDQLQKVHKQLKVKTTEMEEKQAKWNSEKESVQQRHTDKLESMKKRYENEIAFLRNEKAYYEKISFDLRTTNQQLSRDVQVANTSNADNNAASLLFTHLVEIEHKKEEKEEDEKKQIAQLRASEWGGRWEDGRRVQQRADRAHHSNAEKKRRVMESDICDIAELLKLKLISKGIQLRQLISLLQGEGEGWEKEYINLRQMQQRLLAQPCGLTEEQARQLGRYLVEDVQQEFVWVHGANQNMRSVVKSIVGNILKHYQISIQAEKQLEKVLANYGTTLQGTLKGIEPSGHISKKRLLEVLRSVGIDCSEECRELVMAKMAKRAKSLNELVHQDLFSNLPE